jgi:hypothetical protein
MKSRLKAGTVSLKPNTSVTVKMTGQSSGTASVIPASGVSAVMLSVTAVNPTNLGYLTVYPGTATKTDTSAVNFNKGVTRSNRVIVGVGTDGTVKIYNCATCAATVGLLVDVAGYFTSASSKGDGTTYVPLKVPQRLVNNIQWAANNAKWVYVSGSAGIPTPAKDATGKPRNPPPYPWGFVGNITATALDADTTLTMYPLGTPPAAPVDLTVAKGRTVSNTTIARIQFLRVALYSKAGRTNVYIDTFGWFG